MRLRAGAVMDVVELGGARLHILRVHPGLPHEADRVTRELQRLAPAVVLGDLSTDDALRLRAALAAKKPFEPAFLDALFAEGSAERFAPEQKPAEHPLAAAARFARDRRADFVPLRPNGERPGFFARRRLKKRARGAGATAPEAFPGAFAKALAGHWDAASDVEAAHKRLVHALAEGRAPVVAVVQAHRADAYLAAVRATGRIPA